MISITCTGKFGWVLCRAFLHGGGNIAAWMLNNDGMNSLTSGIEASLLILLNPTGKINKSDHWVCFDRDGHLNTLIMISGVWFILDSKYAPSWTQTEALIQTWRFKVLIYGQSRV